MRLIILACCAFALLTDGAWAQRRPAITGNPIKDIQTDLAGGVGAPGASKQSTTNTVAGLNFTTIGEKLQAVTKDVLDKAIADLSAASADAQVHNDKISQPCWDAQAAFLKSLPAEQATPPTEIGPALAIQISRDILNSVTGNDASSLKVSCAALIGDQLSIINQTLGLVGIAGIAGLPAGL